MNLLNIGASYEDEAYENVLAYYRARLYLLNRHSLQGTHYSIFDHSRDVERRLQQRRDQSIYGNQISAREERANSAVSE